MFEDIIACDLGSPIKNPGSPMMTPSIKSQPGRHQFSIECCSVARGGGGEWFEPHHRPEEYSKYPVFSTFEADFCTKSKNSSPPIILSMRIGQEPYVKLTRKTRFQLG